MGKLRTEFTSPLVKSTSPRLSDTTFSACWLNNSVRTAKCLSFFLTSKSKTNSAVVFWTNHSILRSFFLFSAIGNGLKTVKTDKQLTDILTDYRLDRYIDRLSSDYWPMLTDYLDKYQPTINRYIDWLLTDISTECQLIYWPGVDWYIDWHIGWGYLQKTWSKYLKACL